MTGTRGRIVTLLRRSSRTVDELATVLGLTANAIRAHLATLERDGLVQESGRRRTSSKPATIYDLTPAAEDLYARAYSPVLQHLLDELNERLHAQDVEDVLRATGRRMAAQSPLPRGSLRARAEAAVDVLNSLGGLAELEEHEDAYVIRGHSCPLAAAVMGHPEVCRLTHSLVGDVVGRPVQERCDRSGRPACRFVVPAA